MPSPLDSALDIKISLDTQEATKSAKALAGAIKEIENQSKDAEVAANAFSKILGGIGKVATGAFGMVTAVLKAPADLDNYLGQLNQKVSQVDGGLQKYKETFVSFLKEFKPGEGGFGLSSDEYKTVMSQFATGTTALEKYGAARRENLKGFTQGSGMLMKVLGFDPGQASSLLIDMRKTIGLTYPEMEGFAQKMGNIGKSANMSTSQFYSLTKQVTHLAKAYNLSGSAGQKFVTESLKVGAALSQIGFDAEKTMAKMNEVSSGSEKGLIQSLLLGFNPNDPQGQLKAFENQAKMIVAQASSAGPQMAPFVTRMMADAMGMNNFSVEDINRMASGVKSGPGEKKKEATDILEEISATLKNPDRAAERPFVTVAQKSNDILNTLQHAMIVRFDGVLQELKGRAEQIKGYITKAFNFFDRAMAFFDKGELTFTKLLVAFGGMLLLPKIIGATIGAVVSRVIGMAFGGAAAGATGAGAAGAVGVAAASATALASTVILGLVGGVAIGTFIRKVLMTDEMNKWVGDKLLGAVPEPLKKLFGAGRSDSEWGLDKNRREAQARMATGTTVGKPPSPMGAATSGMSKLEGFAKDHNLTITDVNTPGVHKEGSLHYQGQAIDVRTRDKTPEQIDWLKSEATKAGLYYVDETRTKSPHLHVSAVPEPHAAAKAGKVASATTTPTDNSLKPVHDASAVAILANIRDMLGQYLGSQPALAGSPTSNMDNDALVAQFLNGQK